MNKNKRVAVYGLLVALAFIFSYIESMFPMPTIPGMKLGIANLVVLVALYKLGSKEAFSLAVLRIVLVGFTFGNLFSMLYSLSGGMLSCFTMILLSKCKKFSMTGVSIAGGVMHNVGQIVMAMIVLDTVKLYYYLPVLLISGLVAGVVIGILGGMIVKRIRIDDPS